MHDLPVDPGCAVMTVIASRRAVVLGAVVAVPAVAATARFARDTAGCADAGATLRPPLDVAATWPARFAELVRFATLAPNGHNTQAWRFSGEDAQITITPDPARETPAVDPDRHHTFVSLGAAAETLGPAATAYGQRRRYARGVGGNGARFGPVYIAGDNSRPCPRPCQSGGRGAAAAWCSGHNDGPHLWPPVDPAAERTRCPHALCVAPTGGRRDPAI